MTRNDIYRIFKDEYQLTDKDAKKIFRTITDNELAFYYGLTVIGKGRFVKKK